MGKARVFYAQRKYQPALKLFQDVLRLSPTCTPDPRIGIGLCLWALGHKEKAKMAWKRSLDLVRSIHSPSYGHFNTLINVLIFSQNPNEWPSQLLLGIEQLNRSKDYALLEASRVEAAQIGYKHVEKAFNTNKQCAAAANVLSALFLRKGNFPTALKLAERTIQYADTLVVLSDGHIRAALVSHAEGRMAEAMKHYSAAKEGMPNNILANVGVAQMYIHNGMFFSFESLPFCFQRPSFVIDEIPAAIDTLDRLLTPPNPQKSLEAMIMLASLKAHPRQGVSSADTALEKQRARDLLERIVKEIQITDGDDKQRTIRGLGDDTEMWIELARLWENDNLEKTSRAYREASRISKEKGAADDPKVLNNLAALKHLEGAFSEARVSYEAALTHAAKDSDDLRTTILYNLARCYEDLGEVAMAQEAYEKLLARHPEYVDGTLSSFYHAKKRSFNLMIT